MKHDCIARFRSTYVDGTVMAVSHAAAGKEIGRCALRTADPETELRAEPEETCVRPGALCYIRLRYTDKNGSVKPLERGILKVNVTGGRLLGLGSACPYNERGYCGTETDTYFGEALAVVQAGEGKTVALTVTDDRYFGKAEIDVVQNWAVEPERISV
ncbi:MAG: glycoside hydrolase family 2, partial [Oscillospiraceae bacterium]|nr:glycoside hydrolase family 2 [Oscillospiraceae bacterium]